VPNSKLWVDICLLLLNTFPTTICFLKSELRAESYGPEKFRLFFPIYPCMLQVSSFSSCTFLHTQIPNMAPWLSSMVHNISIDYSCAPNKLLSKELCPLEVNWCQNFTLTVLVVTFSYELCFAPRVAHWIALSEVILFKLQRQVYLGTLYSHGF
jgi:hypothetical protein